MAFVGFPHPWGIVHHPEGFLPSVVYRSHLLALYLRGLLMGRVLILLDGVLILAVVVLSALNVPSSTGIVLGLLPLLLLSDLSRGSSLTIVSRAFLIIYGLIIAIIPIDICAYRGFKFDAIFPLVSALVVVSPLSLYLRVSPGWSDSKKRMHKLCVSASVLGIVILVITGVSYLIIGA